MASEHKPPTPAATAEAIRVRRLREDAKRPMSVNLAEGITLSHKLMRFAGAARRVDARLAEVAVAANDRLNVVQGLDGIPAYGDLRARATEADVLGVPVAVCSIEDLKAMKRASGRTRDIADIEDLDAANR